MNRVILMGNLGKDPQELAGGKGCMFTMATSERYKDKEGEWQEKTSWHTVAVWNKSKDTIMKHVRKGDKLAIEGKIEYHQWEDNDGNTKYSTQIVTDRVEYIQVDWKRDYDADPQGDFTPTEEEDLPY